MKTHRYTHAGVRPWLAFVPAVAFMAFAVATPAFGQGKKKNPASKIYVADVGGEAMIDTGDALEDLAKRSVYTAQGTVIQTKKGETEKDRAKNFSTMVYSNGTGAFFDADTRVEVKKFVQEPFTPNRTDVDVEPSISQTQAFVSRGTVGLCSPKLVAGSNMTYQTPQGSVNIRGRKVVIDAQGDTTRIAMLEGESTVRGGTMDTGGHTLKAGEQAIIRNGAPGQPNQIEISRIPPAEAKQLEEKVTMACMAKRTVYFEVRERTELVSKGGATTEETKGGGETSQGEATPGGGTPTGAITAFDGTTPNASSVTVRDIVPVEVVPANLPVQFTVSPARIVTPPSGQPSNTPGGPPGGG